MPISQDIVTITDPEDPRIEVFRDIRERDIIGRSGFIAEGTVVLDQLARSQRLPADRAADSGKPARGNRRAAGEAAGRRAGPCRRARRLRPDRRLQRPPRRAGARHRPPGPAGDAGRARGGGAHGPAGRRSRRHQQSRQYRCDLPQCGGVRRGGRRPRRDVLRSALPQGAAGLGRNGADRALEPGRGGRRDARRLPAPRGCGRRDVAARRDRGRPRSSGTAAVRWRCSSGPRERGYRRRWPRGWTRCGSR